MMIVVFIGDIKAEGRIVRVPVVTDDPMLKGRKDIFDYDNYLALPMDQAKTLMDRLKEEIDKKENNTNQ